MQRLVQPRSCSHQATHEPGIAHTHKAQLCGRESVVLCVSPDRSGEFFTGISLHTRSHTLSADNSRTCRDDHASGSDFVAKAH